MTEERLAEIKARCEAATPGPWRFSEAHEWQEGDGPFDDWGADIQRDADGDDVVVGGAQDEQGGAVGVLRNEDAEFIAASREDVPWLLTEVERLERRVRYLEHDRQILEKGLYEANVERLRAEVATAKAAGRREVLDMIVQAQQRMATLHKSIDELLERILNGHGLEG